MRTWERRQLTRPRRRIVEEGDRGKKGDREGHRGREEKGRPSNSEEAPLHVVFRSGEK